MENLSSYNLILLPGLDGTGLLFEPFLRSFPHPEQVIVIKYPSSKKLDYNELADYVKKQIPDSKDFILLAESFSGPITHRVADHKGLAGVILCASFLSCPRPVLYKLLSFLPCRFLFKIPLPDYIIRILGFGKNCPPSTLSLFRQAIAIVDTVILEYRFRLLAQVDELFEIRKIRVPILYLRASRDMLVPKSCGDLLLTINPSVRIQEIPGTHFLMQSSPDEARETILGFMRSLEKS